MAVLHPGPHDVRLAGHRDVQQLGVDDLLELEGQAVHVRVVELVERGVGLHGLEHPALQVGQEQPRLGGHQGEEEDRVLELVLRGPGGVRVLEVVQEAEELQEHLGRLLADQGVLDPVDGGRDGGALDAVVDGLELLVDQQGQQVAPADLAVEGLPHRRERGVRDPGEARQVLQDQVQVLQGLPQQGEPRLGGRLPQELLHVGVHHVVLLEVPLDVFVELRLVDLVLGEDGRAELHRPEDHVVHQAQLLGPVPEGELLGLPLRERLVLDPEEPLEAPEPHLQLEELVGLPRVRPRAPSTGASGREGSPSGAPVRGGAARRGTSGWNYRARAAGAGMCHLTARCVH